MAGRLSEPENSANTDSLKYSHFRPNHLVVTDSLVNYGKLFLKTPYHYGSPGISSFDCSGFTSHVYRNFGYNLEHSSVDQARQFDTIDRTKLKPGDLVFFSGSRRSKQVGHVGIVTQAKENGEFEFIHAAVHKGVTISNSSESYYMKRFVKASRVISATKVMAFSKILSSVGFSKKDTSEKVQAKATTQTTRKVIPAEYHRVKSGETLSEISEKYGMTVAELKRKNNIKGSKLKLKQILKVKDEETVLIVQTVRPTVKNSEEIAENSTHSVKKGETLSSISKIYNVSIDELKKINNIIKGKIHPGQHLKISQPVEIAKNETPIKKEIPVRVQEETKSTTHKVISGESLSGISKAYNIPVDEIKKTNNITTANIHPGQELKLTQAVGSNVQAANDEKPNKKREKRDNVNEKSFTYKIKKGDNLGSIAKSNHTTVDELERINNLKDAKIHQGQVLKINSDVETTVQYADAEKTDKKQDVKTDSKEKEITHKIRKGENLGSIAKNNHTTVEELERINNLKDAKIHQGQVLKINSDIEAPVQHAVVDKTDNRQVAKNESKEKELTHRIKKGESLISIAKENNMSVDELKRINNMTDTKIRFGQEIKLKPSSEKSKHTNSTIVESESKSIQHKVKSGDSFYTLAKKYGCTVENLKEWNRKSGSKIKIGDEITVHPKVRI